MTKAGDMTDTPSREELTAALGQAIIAMANAAASETVAERAEQYANAALALAGAAATLQVRPQTG